MSEPTPDIRKATRLVVKVGSSLLVDHEAQCLKSDWLAGLCADVAEMAQAGTEVLVVSSGAVALGRVYLGYPRGPLSLEQSQAAASVGQIHLARAWSEALAAHGLIAGQVLLTYGDTEERRRYLNARATLHTLLANRAVPVINENDTVATAELRYGDNDRLAARVASMAEADCLVLLSDIDGLYTAPPAKDPQARLVPLVPHIDAAIEAMAGGAASEFSRGGMATKIMAARLATASGCHMAITSGLKQRPLSALAQGAPCTWFLRANTPLQARKTWIAGAMKPAGTLVVDAGAAQALLQGRSLLPAGVVAIEGGFHKGDTVSICNQHGAELARGLVAYDAVEAIAIVGLKSHLVAERLGGPARTELVHRNDMVIWGR